jgi:hypothetical protein
MKLHRGRPKGTNKGFLEVKSKSKRQKVAFIGMDIQKTARSDLQA